MTKAQTTSRTFEYEGLSYRIEYYASRTHVCLIKSESYKELSSVKIPNEVEFQGVRYTIGSVDGAFSGCQNLKSVIFEGDSIIIRDNSFTESAIEEIIFPQKYTYLYINAIEKCKNLKNLVFNSEFTYLDGTTAPGGALLSVYELPFEGYFENIKFEGDSKMSGHELFAMSTLANNGTVIKPLVETPDLERYAVDEINIDWGNGVHIVDVCGLGWYNGRKLTLGGNVHVLDEIGCPFLETIEFKSLIPHDSDMDNNWGVGFYLYAPTLRTVKCFDATPRDIHPYTFGESMGDMTLYIPSGAISQYLNHPVWSKFGKFQIMNSEVANITADESLTDAPVEYYDLNGRRMESPTPGTISIRKQGNNPPAKILTK